MSSLIALPVAAVLWPQALPPLEIRFYTLLPTYEIGEGVRFALENRHTKTLYLGGNIPWRVQREISGTWAFVWGPYWDAAIIWGVAPGESRHWGWYAANDTDNPRSGPVLPGNYRITIGGSLSDNVLDYGNPQTSVVLFAYFELTG